MRTRIDIDATDFVARTVLGLGMLSVLVMASCSDYGTEPIPPTPSLSLVGDTVGEGQELVIHADLDVLPAMPVTLVYTLLGVTAVEGEDFPATLDSIVLGTGVDQAVIRIPSIQDTLIELTEELRFKAVAVRSANLADSFVTCEIIDDEGLPKLSVANAVVIDGDTITFTVSLNKPGVLPVIFDYWTADGTAETGSDFSAVLGRDTILPGEVSAAIRVATSGGAISEAKEFFEIGLSVIAGAEGFDVSAIGSIVPPTRFAGNVQTVLNNNCYCHYTYNVPLPRGFSIDNYDSVMTSGERGPHVVPGNAEASTLYRVLLIPPPDGFLQMPDGWQLAPEDIKKIKDWIDQGAKNN